MRLLHAGHDPPGRGVAARQPRAFQGRDHRRHGRQPLPLRRACKDRGRDPRCLENGRRRRHMRTQHKNQANEGRFRLNRREFIKLTGAGLFVFFTVGKLPSAPDEAMAQELPTDFNAFLHIGEDGRVACYSGKIEMGQGIVTSLAMMLADELNVPLDNVDMVLGDTDVCPWDRGTFGSLTTRVFGPALLQAAAEARAALLTLASEELGVPEDRLEARDGTVFVQGDPSKSVTYAALTKGKRIERTASGPARLEDPSEYTIMNRPQLRMDAHAKVTGAAQYAGDMRLPGMLYACILREPAHGARLVSVDVSKAEAVEGVRVIRDGDMVAVLHPQWDVAAAALDLVQAEYERQDNVRLDDTSIFDHLVQAAPDGQTLASGGDLKAGKDAAQLHTETTFLDGYVAHAPIEPHTATVHVEGDRVTVWPSSQTPFPAQEQVAQVLGIPKENVRVISPFLGGGFGGKTRNLQVVEAARLSKLAGAPVQVAWSRSDEFFHDSFRPAAVVTINSGASKDGDITYWDFGVYFAGNRGAEHFYAIPHHKTTSYGSWRAASKAHPFAVGAWRAPANNTNTFARESQIEIMAAKAGVDPLEFRLRNLSDDRMRAVLKAAAEKFGWQEAPSPSGKGRGIACGIDADTFVATIAEVDVDQSTGRVTVKRVVCAQDMGLCVNPAGAVIQMEGCITMGLGYTLSEEVHFTGGAVEDRNFDTYELPRFSWLPKIETIILDKPDEPPHGGGEPAIITVGGAVANAIFDACGARVLQLPMTPARVKEALDRKA
ncbi:xanthine dehydrogenase family protein molybdopterin-binding subunit [Oceanidesulfovibrio marinus]|uniref:Xanthine dehydrogenase family protein molybdopterin-binding subunit n=2 Tax=Oceanidesulfovibrio marinus TaxID=370038 RepID=A0ABX6NAW0_9BACT|nr:xanthine dehydrogenase family protein molybdopterin-binding subunit [Oceanidesulfovibrio marinus]